MKSNREHLERTREIMTTMIANVDQGISDSAIVTGYVEIDDICDRISQGIQSILDTGYPLIIQTQYTRDHRNYDHAHREIEKRVEIIMSSDARVKNWNFGMIKGKCIVSISRESTDIRK